jgi:uncharacterized membrane protein YukC
MDEHKVQRKSKEFSPEELDVARALEFYLPHFTIKSLAKSLDTSEEQVRQRLKNLGLLQVVSKERVAERRMVKILAREFYVDLARATQNFYEHKIAQ